MIEENSNEHVIILSNLNYWKDRMYNTSIPLRDRVEAEAKMKAYQDVMEILKL